MNKNDNLVDDNRQIQRAKLFKRLTRLFKSAPIIKRRALNIDFSIKPQGTAAEFFKNISSLYTTQLTGLSSYDRFSRYSDYSEMNGTPECFTALNLYADESTTKNVNNIILDIRSDNANISEILEILFHDTLNINYYLWYWARSVCQFGDLFLFVDLDDQVGIMNLITMPINEVIREEGFDPNDPLSVRYRWITKSNKELSNWQVIHFRILGTDSFLPYGACLASTSRIPLINGNYKYIKDINVGDVIFCFNTKIQKIEKTSVLAKKSNGTKLVFEIKTKHRKIIATENHPFLTDNFSYKQVKNLEINDKLIVSELNFKDKNYVVEKIVSIVPVGSEEVWDIQVDNDDHNFIADGFVVHNSVLEGARRVWRQLIMLEDAMLVYRLVRSPERRIFYVEVGNALPHEVPLIMQQARQNLQMSEVTDEYGRVDQRYKPMDMATDYYIPKRGEVSSRIESLPGGQFTGDIEDVQYLQSKLISALGIPKAYLGYEESLCLAGDTKIKLLSGQNITIKELSELETLDDLYTYSIDENLNIVSGKIIKAWKTGIRNDLYEITLDNNEKIRCTSNHPFMLKNGTYKQAKNLKVSDSLMSLSDLSHKIVNIEKIDTFEDMYDITIDQYHNFALSANIFVHNSGKATLCLDLNTKIPLLDNRIFTLQEIITEYKNNKNVNLWTYSIDPATLNIVPGKISWAGVTRKNAQVVKVKIDDGGEIVCTPDHKFMLRDGTVKIAVNLKSNDSLMPFYQKVYYNLQKNKSNKRFKRIYRQVKLVYNPALNKFVKLHHSIAETFNNYKLNETDIVHHKNFNTSDNSPSNLQIMNKDEHLTLHRQYALIKLAKINHLVHMKWQHQKDFFNNWYKSKKLKVLRKQIRAKTAARSLYKEIYNAKYRHNASINILIKTAKKRFNKQQLIKLSSYSETLINRLLKENNLIYAQLATNYIKEEYRLHRKEVVCAHKSTLNHKVVSVEFLQEKKDVGCVTVDNSHTFFVMTSSDINSDSTGVLVFNSQEDIRWSRTIQRIQKILISELTKIALIHLYTLGYRGDELIDFELNLTNPSNLVEMQKLEIWKSKLEIARDAPDSGLSSDWIHKQLFGFSEEEVKELRSQRVKDMDFKWKLEQVSSNGIKVFLEKQEKDEEKKPEEEFEKEKSEKESEEESEEEKSEKESEEEKAPREESAENKDITIPGKRANKYYEDGTPKGEENLYKHISFNPEKDFKDSANINLAKNTFPRHRSLKAQIQSFENFNKSQKINKIQLLKEISIDENKHSLKEILSEKNDEET